MNAAEQYALLCAQSSVPCCGEVVEALRRRSSSIVVSCASSLPALLKTLTSGLAAFVSIIRLRISSIPSEHLEALAHFLASNRHVHTLDVSRIRLGNSGVLELVAGILRAGASSPLRTLRAADVGLTAKGACALADSLSESRLSHLDLANNRMQASGVRVLSRVADETGVEVVLDGNLCLVETLNAATHGAGAVAALAGAICMTRRAVNQAAKTRVVASVMIFVTSLFAMLCCSCSYHASYRRRELNKRLRQLDHCGVFLLIAGSYTPFCVFYTLDTIAGNVVLFLVWVCAIFGIAISTRMVNMSSTTRALFALGMGWIGIIPVKIIYERMEKGAAVLVVGGGIAYSLGLIFYFLGRKRMPIMHVVWHLAVLIGGGMHFTALWKYVLPKES